MLPLQVNGDLMLKESCTNKTELEIFFRDAGELLLKHGSVNIAATHKPMRAEELSIRSLDQNDMKERQVVEISRQLHGNDENHTRNELKYRCGISILCRDDPKFKAWCELALKHLSYEDRVKAMEYTPVTSRFTIKQMSEYIEKVFGMYAEHVVWTFKDAA